MRLQPQLLSQKRFDEHLDPLPFGGPITTALKGLDESGIQAAYSDGNLLHLKPFNLNFTFGIRTHLCFHCTPHHFLYTIVFVTQFEG